MQLRLKTWHFIVVGITLTVIAASLNHFSIKQKFALVESIQSAIASLDIRIDSLWQQSIEAERKKEFTVLLLEQTNILKQSVRKGTAMTMITGYLESILGAPVVTEDLSKALNASKAVALIEQHQLDLRNQIDDLYLERLQLVDQQAPIEMAINQTRNIALFLQLLGLIFVLSKDLARDKRIVEVTKESTNR